MYSVIVYHNSGTEHVIRATSSDTAYSKSSVMKSSKLVCSLAFWFIIRPVQSKASVTF